MQDMITMKTNLTNSGCLILTNPEKDVDSFFVAVGKFFMEEYATLEPSDVVTPNAGTSHLLPVMH